MKRKRLAVLAMVGALTIGAWTAWPAQSWTTHTRVFTRSPGINERYCPGKPVIWYVYTEHFPDGKDPNAQRTIYMQLNKGDGSPTVLASKESDEDWGTIVAEYAKPGTYHWTVKVVDMATVIVGDDFNVNPDLNNPDAQDSGTVTIEDCDNDDNEDIPATC